MTFKRTRAVPARTISIWRAAPTDRSMMRPCTKGPRSVMRTSTCLPFERLVISTQVSKGRARCAAVSFSISKISPEAVGRPLYGTPYQLAIPVSVDPMRAGSRALVCRAQPVATIISASTHATHRTAMRARPAKMGLRSTKTILLDIVLSIPGLARAARCLVAPLPRGSFFS